MFSSFMINAWMVGTMVAVLAGFIGFFVVTRGSSFAAHALPLGAFPGAALASLIGVNQFIGIVIFSGLGVVGISQLSRFARRDIATAMSLVMLLGLGALFLSMTAAYSQQVYALLFGEVLGISDAEVIPILGICVICVGAILITFRRLLLSSAAPALGEVMGISRRGMELWFLGLVALATAAAVPVVGVLLIFSLMVAPAAAARAFTDQPFAAMLGSVGIALATVWASIAFSYITDWPVGFFVGVIGVISFGCGQVWTTVHTMKNGAVFGR